MPLASSRWSVTVDRAKRQVAAARVNLVTDRHSVRLRAERQHRKQDQVFECAEKNVICHLLDNVNMTLTLILLTLPHWPRKPAWIFNTIGAKEARLT
jgi:hypothetical protein